MEAASLLRAVDCGVHHLHLFQLGCLMTLNDASMVMTTS
jgi:hypothetical protein